MCGINGIVDTNGVSAGRLDRMTDAQAHRGPDGRGTWYRDHVGFGHRRLSIIDVDGSPQPMPSADGRLCITFNGEIYNYRQLRRMLDEDNVDWQTDGDTEVVLELYRKHRERCVDYLRGMFAFAIYDTERRELFAARDHLGQKPFFYTCEGGRFGFASEIKALLAMDPSLRELDDAALHEYLTLRIISPPRSMFKRIRKLAPGHALRFADGRLDVWRYWDLRYQPKQQVRFDDALDELEARMSEAVGFHLVADVPVGAFLSGGMDSSLIAELMTRHTEPGFPTFAGEIPYAGYSELPYARLVADKIGSTQHEISIEPSLVSGLADLVWHLDEPSDPLSVCMYHISSLASQHVKVVLGGDGGDELFGGYDRYFGNVYASYYALLPQALRRHVLGPLLAKLPQARWYRSVGHQLRWMHEMAMYDDGLRYGNSLAYFYFSDRFRQRLYTPAFASRAAVFDPQAHIAEYFDQAEATDLLDRMLYADSNIRMPDHPVMILDRMSMAHGLEARSPFMDHELATYCASLPSRFKVSGRKLRVIEKAMVKRLLPPQLLTRGKQGFSSPLPYVLAKEFDGLYQRLLKDAHLVRDGYLQRQGLNELVDEHLSKRVDHGQRLWQLVNAESWYRMHIESQSRDDLQETITSTTPIAA